MSLMLKFLICFSTLWLHLTPDLSAALNQLPLAEYSLHQLEQQLEKIESDLELLAHYTMRTGVGATGYRSAQHADAHAPEWIRIQLEAETTFDEIILVPSLRLDSRSKRLSDGFPVAFKVYAGTEGEEHLIASYTTTDELLPRIAPLVIPCPQTKARWIEIRTTEMSPRPFDDFFHLALSEVFIFRGNEPISLNSKALTPPLKNHFYHEGRQAKHLNDGFTPYVMDAAQGEQSNDYNSPIGVGDHPFITIDLEQKRTVTRMQLHTVNLSDTIPQTYPTGFGLPTHLTIQVSIDEAFSNPHTLAEFKFETNYDIGPIINLNLPATVCRYIRIHAVEPYRHIRSMGGATQLGFAEVEVFSGNHNVALGKSVTASYSDERPTPGRHLNAITDGHNFYGKILPIHDWMSQLARRHDLEKQIPRVRQELAQRYATQKIKLRILGGTVTLLIFTIIVIILLENMLRQRSISQIKERFAADLHDELGANIHTIGLLGDMTKASIDSKEEALALLDRARVFTERSGAAARHCTNMLEAKGLYDDLIEDMRRTCHRTLADLEHTIEFSGEEHIRQLSPRKRIDLYLFYNEALINVIRHSEATAVETTVMGSSSEIRLTVLDNGTGLQGVLPNSLRRRARLLRAEVQFMTPAGGGTQILLILNPKRFRLFK